MDDKWVIARRQAGNCKRVTNKFVFFKMLRTMTTRTPKEKVKKVRRKSRMRTTTLYRPKFTRNREEQLRVTRLTKATTMRRMTTMRMMKEKRKRVRRMSWTLRRGWRGKMTPILTTSSTNKCKRVTSS